MNFNKPPSGSDEPAIQNLLGRDRVQEEPVNGQGNDVEDGILLQTSTKTGLEDFADILKKIENGTLKRTEVTEGLEKEKLLEIEKIASDFNRIFKTLVDRDTEIHNYFKSLDYRQYCEGDDSVLRPKVLSADGSCLEYEYSRLVCDKNGNFTRVIFSGLMQPFNLSRFGFPGELDIGKKLLVLKDEKMPIQEVDLANEHNAIFSINIKNLDSHSGLLVDMVTTPIAAKDVVREILDTKGMHGEENVKFFFDRFSAYVNESRGSLEN